MNKYLKIYSNWRVHVLTILFIVDILLLFSEPANDNTIMCLLITKTAGVTLAYGIYRLVRYWDTKGKINELKALAKEED